MEFSVFKVRATERSEAERIQKNVLEPKKVS